MSVETTPSPAKPKDGWQQIAYGVVGSLVAAALIYAGSLLVESQLPNEATLQATYSEKRVGTLASWYVKLDNNTSYAVDLQFTPPKTTVLSSAFSPPAGVSASWSGSLARNARLEALFVLDDATIQLSPKILASLVSATYQDRNSQTGFIEKRSAQIAEGGFLSLPRFLLLMFWFLLPTILLGGVSFAGWLGYRWLNKRVQG